MRHFLTPVVVAALFAAAAAHAGGDRFAVSAEVIDRRAAPAVFDAVPMPPQARLFEDAAGVRNYAWTGEPAQAAAFFDAEMPRRGYRALSQRGDGAGMQQLWQGERSRVLLRLQPVLGSAPGTRIRLLASSLPAPAGMPMADAEAPR